MLAIRLPQSVEKRLEKLARRTGRTKTYYVREAILQHLEEIEDVYLAERALERIRSGKARTITSASCTDPESRAIGIVRGPLRFARRRNRPSLCWLPGTQDCALGFERKLDRHEVSFRKQVVFPGFVNYAQHSMLARYTVGQSDIDFSQLERGRVLLVLHTDDQPPVVTAARAPRGGSA